MQIAVVDRYSSMIAALADMNRNQPVMHDTWETPEDYDLKRTLWLAGMGHRDPSLGVTQDEAWLAFHTPEGPVSVHGKLVGVTLTVQCLGEGRQWMLPRVSALFGLHDSLEAFQPSGKVLELQKRLPGAHLPTLPVVFHRLVQVVLQQLVTWPDALRGWIKLTQQFGSAAPGDGGLRLAPSASEIARMGYYDLVSCNIMPRQARLIQRLAREARRLERLADQADELAKYLLTIRGIGDWTVQHLLGTSCGVSDAVLTGDFGLPHTVAWYLAGKERSDDEEMLRLLEPYRGHRFRVINLLWQSGIEAPRRGPKMQSNRWRFTQGSRNTR